ncbi:uncharacterized protein [Periplaneta americana]|uniref:uncharacterized protein isoform X1 n=1 Tax=Periplaneta americana TaxID=6978 RepID=UPI0037E78B7C
MEFSYFDLLTLYRPTKIDELISSVKKPRGGVPKNGLPAWDQMALSSKLPMCKMPQGIVVFSRNKIGRKLWKTGKDKKFSIYDPNCIEVGYKYNALHDEHLRSFFSRRANRDFMLKMGLINKKGEVICTLKEFNEYRRHLNKIHVLDIEKEIARKREIEKENQLLLMMKKFAFQDLESSIKKSINLKQTKDIKEKRKREAEEREQSCVLRRKRYTERVNKLAKRREEERKERILKGYLQDETIRNRIALANELEYQKRIATLRYWHDSEVLRQSRLKTQRLENKMKQESQIAAFWNKKKQEQRDKIEKNKKIIENLETDTRLRIALRNKKLQVEAIRLEVKLAYIICIMFDNVI